MNLKRGSKIIGWDDGPFRIGETRYAPLVGVITRGGDGVDGIIKTEIEVDGLSGTDLIAKAVEESKHREELRLILLDGITFGGFNVVDINRLAEKTGIPVLAVTRNKVDRTSFKDALKNLPNFDQRWEAVKHAGKVKSFRTEGKLVFYQTGSLSSEEAETAIRLSSTYSTLPEPIRLADMIARALVNGES